MDQQWTRGWLFIVFATLDPTAGYKGITAFVVKGHAGFTVAARKTSWASAPAAPANWC